MLGKGKQVKCDEKIFFFLFRFISFKSLRTHINLYIIIFLHLQVCGMIRMNVRVESMKHKGRRRRKWESTHIKYTFLSFLFYSFGLQLILQSNKFYKPLKCVQLPFSFISFLTSKPCLATLHLYCVKAQLLVCAFVHNNITKICVYIPYTSHHLFVLIVASSSRMKARKIQNTKNTDKK